MLFNPARPFRTFQNKVWVSSNCAQCPAAPRKPGSCLHLCQRHPPTAVTDSCNFTRAWDLFRRIWVFFNQSKFSSFWRSVCRERVLLDRIVKVTMMMIMSCEWCFQGDVCCSTRAGILLLLPIVVTHQCGLQQGSWGWEWSVTRTKSQIYSHISFFKPHFNFVLVTQKTAIKK